MAFKKLVQCPSCKFANRFGDAQCLICKTPLPQKGEAEAPGPRRQRPPPRPRPDRLTQKLDKEPARPQRPRRPPQKTVPGGVKRVAPRRDRPAKPKTKVPRLTPEATSKTIAWLCCDPLPPIPLGPATTLIVGRADDADLVLPHKEVSRHHGVIKVRGKRLISYEDEGSSNGSFLNGKRISNTVIKVGDVVTLGPYELEILSNEEMRRRAENSADGDTKSFELTSVARVNPSAAMSGQLTEVPLSEVLQGIEFNKKTGTLSVLSGRRRGKLVVAGGLPMQATLGGLKDDEAVLEMLSFEEGRFVLSGAVEPAEKRMEITLTGLLLEFSRRLDEGDDTVEEGFSEPAALDGEVAPPEPEPEPEPEPAPAGEDESSLGWLDSTD